MKRQISNSCRLIALFLINCAAFHFSACKDEETIGEPSVTDGEPVSLSVGISIPEIEPVTRSTDDSSEADWNDFQKAVDGRVLYRVTAFLIRKDVDKLVAYRNLFYNRDGTEFGDVDLDAPNSEPEYGGKLPHRRE